MGDHDDPRDREEWERKEAERRGSPHRQKVQAAETDHIFKVRAVPSGRIRFDLPAANTVGEPTPDMAAEAVIVIIACENVSVHGLLWSGSDDFERRDDGVTGLDLAGGITLESSGNDGSPVLQALNLYPLTVRHGKNTLVVAIAPEAIRQIKNATNPDR